MAKQLVSVDTDTMLPPTSVVDALRAEIAPSIGTVPAGSISDSTPIGRGVLTANTAAVVRNIIGAGTSDLALGASASDAKPGDWRPTVADVSDATTLGRTLMQVPSAAAGREALGAASVAEAEYALSGATFAATTSVRVVTAGARPSDAAAVYFKMATSPVGALGGDWWYNTSTGVLRHWNGVTSAWV